MQRGLAGRRACRPACGAPRTSWPSSPASSSTSWGIRSRRCSFGVRVRRILLMPIGGMAEFDAIPRKPTPGAPDHGRGPGGQLRDRRAPVVRRRLPGGWQVDSASVSLGGSGPDPAPSWNLVMGIFNLIPAFPMDGGRILRALLATQAALPAGHLLGGDDREGGRRSPGALHRPVPRASISWSPSSSSSFMAGEAEYRSVKRREAEEAYWKQVLHAAHCCAATDEPPLLNS